MNIPLLDLTRQYAAIADEAEAAVCGVLRGAQYIMGENVKAFEAEFASYLGVKYAVSVGNGTDALSIALMALGIGPGDEVITTPYTFFASAEAISAVGATPVFVDVDPRTYNLDPQKVSGAVTSRTRAILPVHIFGLCADMPALKEIARQRGLYLIEDACQAAGGACAGKKAGAWSDMACFSFFPTKNLGCAGDGGMIVTDREELAVAARALRAHGSGENGRLTYTRLHPGYAEQALEESGDHTVYNPGKYYNYLIGRNSRLDEIQAALLRVKLKHLDEYVQQRRFNAAHLTAGLAGTRYTTPWVPENTAHAYHQYVLLHPERARMSAALREKGIATGIYYPVPVHLQKVYAPLGYRPGDLPVSERLSREMFAIPVYPELTDEQLSYLLSALTEADHG